VNGTLVVEVCFALSDRVTFLMKVSYVLNVNQSRCSSFLSLIYTMHLTFSYVNWQRCSDIPVVCRPSIKSSHGSGVKNAHRHAVSRTVLVARERAWVREAHLCLKPHAIWWKSTLPFAT
jgi:hypothetical protein